MALRNRHLLHPWQSRLSSPQRTSNPATPPEYPYLTTNVRLSGAVTLNVTIDTTGHVTEVKSLDSDMLSPHGIAATLSSFDIAAVKNWIYTPFDQ